MGEGGLSANDNLNLLKGLSIDPVEAAVIREEVSAETPTKSAPYPWILSPKIDLLFCCGGLFWVIYLCLALTNFKLDLSTNNAAFWLAATSIIGMHIFGDGHAPATFFRVYFSKDTRTKLGLPAFLVFLAAVAVGLTVFYVPNAATIALKIILAWGFQHQMAQSYGISLIYCYKRQYYLNKIEKLIMAGMVNATIAFMIVRMFSSPDFNLKALNGFTVPYWGVLPEWSAVVALGALQISVLAFVGMIVSRFIKTKQMFPLPALLTIMTLILLAIIARGAFATIWWAFSTNWFHSCQYLVVTSAFYFKEKGLPENVAFSQISKMLWTWTSFKYFGLLLSVGFTLAYLFPRWMIDHGVNAGIAFTTVYVASNFYHYITDGFIWKLRDPQVNKLLIS
jgi:hypothetical protein